MDATAPSDKASAKAMLRIARDGTIPAAIAAAVIGGFSM
jgi:hypothetical protein